MLLFIYCLYVLFICLFSISSVQSQSRNVIINQTNITSKTIAHNAKYEKQYRRNEIFHTSYDGNLNFKFSIAQSIRTFFFNYYSDKCRIDCIYPLMKIRKNQGHLPDSKGKYSIDICENR